MQVLSVLDTNTKTGNNHANSNKTDGTGDLSHYNFKTDESRLTIDGGDVRDDFRRLDDKALELRMYEQIFGDTADRDGSLNGDGVQKVRAQIEVRNAVQSKDVSMKNYNNKDDVEVDNDEQDTNSQVSFFRWKQKLIKFGTNLFKSYKEIINSKTDSEKTHVPENVRRISNTLKEKYVKQRGAIIDVHHRILKDKRGDNFPNDPINDSPTVDQNELDNVLNIRLSDLISMQQTNKIKPNVNKSHSILTEANPREKCDLSLKDNSNVVESCSNARLKQLLNIKKLMDRNMDSNYKRPVVKKIRVREHEITYDTSGENNSTFNFDDADNSGKKEFRTCVTETEYTYSKVHDSLNSLADDLEKCSILENIEGSKEAYSSIFSKRVYIYKKYSNF